MTRFALILALAMGGLAASPALASKEPVYGRLTVIDDAGIFTADGISEAKSTFSGTPFHSPLAFTVHAVNKVPESKKADFDAARNDKEALGRFVGEWAKELARKEGGRADVYALVLVSEKDKSHFEVRVITNKRTDVRGFPDSKCSELAKKFGDGLRAIRDKKLGGEEAKKEMNGALLAAANLVIEDLRDTTVHGATQHSTADSATNAEADHKGSSIMGYVCIGIAVLLGLWLVFGLIRAFTGGGGGGMGGGGMGGGGMGGGYGGGGGGGFMSGMLGGMFGGLAGSWMYNHFLGGGGGMSGFGGGDSSNLGSGGAGGDNTDTGGGDYDSGASGGDAGGGDWGDSGGGDAGGGGDWGGGDAGGGGDFGGGDAGGGGDW